MANTNAPPTTKNWHLAPPVSYFGRASSFAEAARILDEHQKRDFTPYLFCCGQATELALKGFLLLGGASEASFPSDPGHDLARAWRSAAQGGAPLAPDPPQWCQLLSVAHARPFDSRYPRANVLMGLPSPSVMLTGIDELVAALRVALGIR